MAAVAFTLQRHKSENPGTDSLFFTSLGQGLSVTISYL